MKFITEDGKIAEGIPLTDEQARQRENLVAYFHEEACRSSYHGYQETKQCETLATAFVTGGILVAANKQTELDPTPVSQIETSPISETTSQPTPESFPASTVPAKDDIPF
jgi:hypothetical protein